MDTQTQPWLTAAATRAAPSLRTSDIGSEDWDTLFGAIQGRLRLIVAEATEAAVPTVTRARVLECVGALGQLHAALLQERGRRERIERELREAHGTLARLRTELSGTQAGERRARHRAEHDELTTLPNRSLFRERLDQALARAVPADKGTAPKVLAVLYLDLDGFKPINDHHGHDTGDQLLRIVAARLAGAVRASDTVCRLGGDEFACLLTDDMNRERLSHLACKLFDAVSAPLKLGALELTVRPSIGIARCPDDGASAELLLKRADAAMYRAKRRQMGYAFFDGRNDA